MLHLMCSSRKEWWGHWKTGGTILSVSRVITNKTEPEPGVLQPGVMTTSVRGLCCDHLWSWHRVEIITCNQCHRCSIFRINHATVSSYVFLSNRYRSMKDTKNWRDNWIIDEVAITFFFKKKTAGYTLNSGNYYIFIFQSYSWLNIDR